MIAFTCPKCGATFEVEDSMAGKQAKCGKCDAMMVVPAKQDAKGAAPAAERVNDAPPPPPGAHAVGVSGMAIAALVCGLLGIACAPFGLIGVILGIIALVRINNSQGALTGQGLAIGGICAGAALGLASLAFTAGMLWPAIGRPRGPARRARCVNNLKQIGLSLKMYANDHYPADCYPPGPEPSGLSLLYNGYVSNLKVFDCPSSSLGTAAPGNCEVSYGFVYGMTEASTRGVASSTAADTPVAGDKNDSNHGRNDGGHLLYVDGHVKFRKQNEYNSDLNWLNPGDSSFAGH